jgi:hypothetical protein
MSNLSDAVDELVAEDVHALTATTLGSDVIELDVQIARLQADRLRRIGVFDAMQGWAADGASSCAGWLRARCRTAPSAASEQARVARKLRELPETETAFAEGTIGYDHVRTMVHGFGDMPSEKVVEAEPLLTQAARSLDPKQLGKAVGHWRHAVEPEVFLAEANSAYESRRLHLSETIGGGVLDGRADAEGFATIATAVHALSAPVPGDTRTPAQRRFDALVQICRGSLDTGTLPRCGGEKPHLAVQVALETLEGRAGVKAADLDWGGPIPGETARRLACDAAITRIITDGASQVLDVGRTTRTIPAAIRRAVVARQPTCTEDGCDVPAAWCDLHHIVHWINGGPTSVENLEPRCGRHHRDDHEGHNARGP